MPVYNCELYIREAIDSILNQTFINFEFIIIDDCSADATVSIIKSYQDSRINLIVKPQNSGYTKSLNFGLQIAKGQYIARMDGDDISLPQRFEKQVAFLENNLDVVLCGTQFSIIQSNMVINVPEFHEQIKLELLNENAIAHPSVMIRKAVFENLEIAYNPEKEPAEDYDLWTRLLLKGKLHNLQEPLLKYRVHSQQVSKTRVEKQVFTANAIKFNMLRFSGAKLSKTDEVFFYKIISKNKFSEVKDFEFFFIFREKIISENTYFHEQGLKNYFNNLEFRLLTSYFCNRRINVPKNYVHYLKIKFRLQKKLHPLDELKLLIKSILFYKV